MIRHWGLHPTIEWKGKGQRSLGSLYGMDRGTMGGERAGGSG